MSSTPRSRQRCFIALPQSSQFIQVREAVQKAVREAGFAEVIIDKDEVSGPSTIQETLIGDLARADCLVADVSGRNPQIYFILGLGQAMGKALFPIVREAQADQIPTDLRNYQYLNYEDTPTGLIELRRELEKALRNFKRSPRRTNRSSPGSRFVTPFYVDWDRLDGAEIDNLIRELLVQLGYRRVDWVTESNEIDLIAELPKKDPDGFEFREFWLISMGKKASQQMVFEMASKDPEFFIYNSLRDDNVRRRLSSRGDTPNILLLIQLKGDMQRSEFQALRNYTRHNLSGNLRIRFWDREYLTTLVQQFPLIGYKYFSEEARFRSQYRKTYEELYEETLRLNESLASALAALEDEKNKRIRAERDAVWKDISFSAAHKIGNPIFAIETYLEPLTKRVREARTNEAVGVIDSIRNSVERAKAIVDQFKSLTRAQEIKPKPIILRPILDEICKAICNEGLDCEIECSADLVIQADQERLTESFEELARNAAHWCKSPGKKIQIIVSRPSSKTLPQSVDSTKQYVLVQFKDNGPGVSLENKERIFDAFFTERDHGTGLGLALVRRIIEGHGGFIFETGVPGEGANFEIYLPIIPVKADSSSADTRKIVSQES